jgi:hypothetical protein
MSSQTNETVSSAEQEPTPERGLVQYVPNEEQKRPGHYSMDHLVANGLRISLSRTAADALAAERERLAAEAATVQQRIADIDTALPGLIHPELP